MKRFGAINKFWWFAGLTIAATVILVIGIGVLFWQELDPGQKTVVREITKAYFAYIFIAFFFIVAALFITLDAIFHNYIIPVTKITEQTAIIAGVNPAYRIKLEGGRDVKRLAEIINLGAERFEQMRRDTSARIASANAELEAEKNVLAGFIGELPQGVLVCNREGRILLYNRQAQNLLTQKAPSSVGEGQKKSAELGYIGLGRSIFKIIDKNLLQHAQEELEQKLVEPETVAVSQFLVVGHGGNFINAEMAPILDDDEHLNGFILVLENITARLQSKQKIASAIHKLTTLMRASLAGTRSAIETIVDFPDIGKSDLNRFHQIIHKETVALSDHLDEYIPQITPRSISRWPLIPVKGDYLVAAVLQKAADQLNIQTVIKRCDGPTWVKIESYSMVFAVLFVLDQLRTATGSDQYGIDLIAEDEFVFFELIWDGNPLKLETLRGWRRRSLVVGNESIGLTLDEVLQNHSTELWTYRDHETPSRNHLRFYLPSYQFDTHHKKKEHVQPIIAGRPEFYDFDLFHQPGQNPEVDERAIKDLTYTVFDTETTGLNPTEGDRIISIGAVRIVNGRLLKEELFDQLINPERSVPQESTNIHGISSEMLTDQPTMDIALPRFEKFTGDTILIAHNAAFDMRMLQIYETSTGIRFINPVLDTLLLSAVIHPSHNTHTMGQIAQRLGVEVAGRHTALGDAIATGEIFLKMIPLLTDMGITTLGQARQASQRTYYARLKY